MAQSLSSPFDTTCFIGKDIFTEFECKNLISKLQNPVKIDTSNTEKDVLRIVERSSLKVINWLKIIIF
jgi:hypothetical protein